MAVDAPYDLYLKTGDAKGNQTFTSHRVYDGVKFTNARMAEAAKEGGYVVPITEQEYNEARKAKRK